MRTSLVSIALLSLACACSTAEGTGVGTTSSGAGGSATVACDSPDATPTTPCGSLTFAASDVKSRKRNHHVSFLATTKAGSFIYVIGGTNGSFPLKNVDRFPLGEDGSLAPSVDQSPLPVAVGGLTGGVATSGATHVVVVAGGTNGAAVTDQSYAAVVGDDGTLGAWSPAGSVLHPRMHPGAIVKGDTVYVMGGFDDPDVWDDVVRATVGADGTLSAWSPAGTLPGKRSHFSVTRVGDDLYLAGGLDHSAFGNPPMLADTWHGHLAADGTVGDWTPMPPLPVGLATHASFYYGGYLYVGGGITDSPPAQERRFWRSPIQADRSLGPWEEAAPLPIARGHVHQLPVYRNHVYSIGGAIDFNLTSTDEIDVGTFQ